MVGYTILKQNSEKLWREIVRLCSFTILLTQTWGLTYSVKNRGQQNKRGFDFEIDA